ncbi:MAG: phage head morphogenesis protein [Bacteroidales bacterium]
MYCASGIIHFLFIGGNLLPFLYPPCDTSSFKASFDGGDTNDIQLLAMQLAQRIFDGEDISSDDTLLRLTAEYLLNGVEKGFNGDILSFDFNSPDLATLTKLTEDVYQFAGAKNYHELKDLSLALTDGDKVLSFEEFSQKAEAIIGKYNVSWLRSEYNQAIASAQSAARWNDFQKTKDIMPYLRYEAVMDGNTREEHALLNGVVKRIDDKFWDKYLPPNGWGCRCEAVQLPFSSYEETSDNAITYPNVPPMFQINFGKQQIIFPPSHPYYKGIPSDEVKNIKKHSREAYRNYTVAQAINNFEDFSTTIDGVTYDVTMNNLGVKHFAQDLFTKDIFFYKNNFLIYTKSAMTNLEYFDEADVDLNHNTGKKTLKLKGKCDKFIYFKTKQPFNNKYLYIQCMRYRGNQKIFLYSASTKPPKNYEK